jgi:hypothetical protein
LSISVLRDLIFLFYFISINLPNMRAIIWVPVTLAMVVRAHKHNSLTPAGIVAAVFTAVAHAVHPWSLPFVLLIVFFLAGTQVTKVRFVPEFAMQNPRWVTDVQTGQARHQSETYPLFDWSFGRRGSKNTYSSPGELVARLGLLPPAHVPVVPASRFCRAALLLLAW